MSTSRSERQQIISEAISNALVHSQADVVKILRRHGIRVTQATASRDLVDLGAVRGKGSDGEISYQLPKRDEILMSEGAIDIRSNGLILVVRTRPGAAQLVAARIDSRKVEGILGTIAGDDTVFVALAKPGVGKRVSEAIREAVAGNNGRSRRRKTKSKGQS